MWWIEAWWRRLVGPQEPHIRHDPDHLGLELDPAGWCDVTALLEACRSAGHLLDRETLEQVVAGNDKQRFALSPDGSRIRARQGHSVPVELGLEPRTPPELLYQGTVERFLESIRREGLRPMGRHHVHLSADVATAEAVGRRRGKPVILVVRAAALAEEGHEFFLTENGVWLTDRVPTEFLVFPDDDRRQEPGS